MNKQKINAYLEESLQPWNPRALVVKGLTDNPVPNAKLILAGRWAIKYIKNLIKDKS